MVSSLTGRVRHRVVELHRGGSSWLVGGSVVAGVAAYLFQLLASRALGDEAFAPISVLWTIQYLLIGVLLFGLETFVTRALTLHGRDRARLRRSVVALAAWAVGCAMVLTGVTWHWRDRLFAGLDELPFVVGALVLAYAAFLLVRGGLAGQRRFHAYGTVTALESVVRLTVAVPVVLLAASTQAVAWVLPVGAVVAALWWVPAQRRPRQEEAPQAALLPLSTPVRFLVLTTVANAAAQTLLAAGPLVLVALAATPAQVSVLFVTVTLLRAPIVLAYGGVLSRLLPPLVRLARSADPRPLRRVVDGTLVGALLLAAAGALGGYLLGPAVVGLLFGPDFAPPALVAAAAAAGVLLASAALLLNQVLVAQSAERRLVLPWLLGVAAAAIAILLVAADPLERVAAGFVVGELVALAGLAVAARPPRRRTVPA